MASKQLGKLRQWAGEKVSKDKSHLTDEFRDLEKDVELRKVGIERIHVVADAYHKSLTRKKESDAESTKTLPVEALGLAMIAHGNDFGAEAAYGQSLSKMGRAHIKIAALEEEFAESFCDTFLGSLDTLKETMREFGAQRKKLESRRLAYDAAITKVSKCKKEKERRDAEEELSLAKARYEETSEDVQSRMFAIQDDEINQLRDLSQLLDLELNYVEKYHQTLSDVRKEWVDESVIQQVDLERPKGAPHVFTNRSERHTRSKSGGQNHHYESDSDDAGFGVRKEKKKSGWIPGSLKRNMSLGKSRSNPLAEDMDHEPKEKENGSKFKMSGSNGSLTFRKRDKSFTALDEADDDDRTERGSRMVRSMSSKSTKKADRGHGDEEEDEDVTSLSRSQSTSKLGTLRSRTNSRASSALALTSTGQTTSRPPSRSTMLSMATNSPPNKMVRAIFDYNAGSDDELTLRVGDEIVVLQEFAEGWWVGLLNGREGMFPGNHTEEMVPRTKKPTAPPRPASMLPGRPFSGLSANPSISVTTFGGIAGHGAHGGAGGGSVREEGTPMSGRPRLMPPVAPSVTASSRGTSWGSDGASSNVSGASDSGGSVSHAGAEEEEGKRGLLRGTPGSKKPSLGSLRSRTTRGSQRQFVDSPLDLASPIDLVPLDVDDSEPFGDHRSVKDLHHQYQRDDNHPGTPERNYHRTTPSVSGRKPSFGANGGKSEGSPAQKKAAPPPPPSRRATNTSMAAAVNESLASRPAPGPPSQPRSKSNSISAGHGRSMEKSPFAGSDTDGGGGGGNGGAVVNCGECGCDDFKPNPFKSRGHCAECFHYH